MRPMSIFVSALFHSPWPYRIARFGLGAVFLWAGAAKLAAPKAFARMVSGYGLVPPDLLMPFALGLPVLELLAGAGLVFDVRGSLKTVAGLLLLFLMVLGYAILTDMDVDCGCFSTEEIHARNDLKIAFVRDVGLLLAVAYMSVWRRVHRGRSAVLERERLEWTR